MQSIIGWWHQRAGVNADVAAMGRAIVTATVDIYQAIRKELLPTPAKSHYTYNMRDLSKVFQGISMVGVQVDSPEKMARWVVAPMPSTCRTCGQFATHLFDWSPLAVTHTP